jgi:ZIP Zinc transporter
MSRKDVLLLYSAICAHKVFTTMSLATRFLRLGCPLKLMTMLLLPFHLLPPLAIVLSAVVGSDSPLSSLILVSISTGTFLYVGAFEVVCEEFAEHEDHDDHEDRDDRQQHHGHEIPSIIADDVLQTSEEQMISTVASIKKHAAVDWRPSKQIKFAMFALGACLLLGITAGLPKDLHA